MSAIRKVAVIGAGVMGSGIAAHVANAGTPVVLLDIVAKGERRSALAEAAIERLGKQSPAPLMDPRNVERITPGNLGDDLGLLADCDWICEAVLENLAIKHATYRTLEAARRPGSIITSNTSTIPLKALVEGLPGSFVRDFAITHFFNPVRYMRLLEVVPGPSTRADALAALGGFADERLGKTVVRCKDTPGFIANRIGIFWSTVAMVEALALGLSVEEADAIVGAPMGIPKTGIFGLMDLTGIDLAPHINDSMLKLLPAEDPFRIVFDAHGPLARLIADMIREGHTGRKGKGGFYRLVTADGERRKEARDLATGAYRPAEKPEFESARAARRGGLRALVEHADAGGRYAWRVLSQVLSYAAELVPEISDDVAAVDTAMRTGYAWKQGPFEQIDALGTAWFAERLAADGRPVPPLLAAAAGRPFYREAGAAAEVLSPAGRYVSIAVRPDAWRLADKKRGRQPIASNPSASLWDVDDGVACLEFHSKMNAIDAGTLALVVRAAQLHRQGFKALIIGNDGENFSVGANIGLALFAANAAMWPLLEQNVKAGQDAYLGLKYAPFPVVGAPAGMALGGGCEILLHCSAIQAHAETYMGLVETGVGIIPAWGGTKEMVSRAALAPGRPGGLMPPVAQAFETISLAKISRSAAEARALGFLRPGDGITMNRDRLLADAKAKALDLARDYQPPKPAEIVLPGPSGRVALDLAVTGFVKAGKASRHDQFVARALATVVTGGGTDMTEAVSEKQLLALEREAFLALIRLPKTLDRMEHTLATGKPLRN
ncbi:MAG: 3-hydroxyacyl-CoA dehydrogenase/enoyl-CoA hydratase family protein [Alphaproteobacteria bacterium]|nr:3-hydroxyacyl-CoA dehydrogenase/enoyl-CoA hydratase family protein [Alphaproteobacteria bacterium]